ncbi:protein of unknown function [Amycolatopsis xylanica]|uniref:DUF397 domain-containing protein n=1 Tax=Amycolatopsis xylanica TaxID=589385 RepID=A0A1H3F0M7_9PSEU|nr:DUF397 domain-containing protein [Amycolatopsis xylanica]SDX83749.1 protein of unknown function [Amycolatopsis xylanica]
MARRKSAFVVEVEPSGLRWVKSSVSASSTDDCVELAISDAAVMVRDSKDRSGPRLVLAPAAWDGLLNVL